MSEVIKTAAAGNLPQLSLGVPAAIGQQNGPQQPLPSSAALASGVQTGLPPSIQAIHGLHTTVSSSTPGQKSNICIKMQPQHVANNTAGNGRSNQPTAGAIHCQTSSSPAPRNRYVGTTPLHLVLQQIAPPYAQFQQFEYSHQYFQNSYYPHYVPQAPQHPRSDVNPGVGIGLSTAMIVQPGGSVSGPAAAGNPSQLPIGVPAASSVLNVGNASTAQPVGVPPHVGMPHQPPQQQQQQHIKGKLRPHALQIIHPTTNRNILEDLDNENKASTPRPILSALSNAPSVKILPTQTKKSKNVLSSIQDEKKTLTLPQQKKIVDNKQEQKHQQPCSNVIHKNEAVTITILASTAEITNSDFGNNNNVSKITGLSANSKNNKSIDKFDNENENITNQKANSTPTGIVDVTSSTSKISVHDCNETDLATISPKTDLECSTSDNETTSITASTRETIILSTTQSGESLSTADCINDGEGTRSDTATVTNETTTNESEEKSAVENVIKKKQYNREQLMQLRDAKASRKLPKIKNTSIFSQTNSMPVFASCGGVKEIQSMVGAIGGARGNGDGGNYQNNYMKQSSMSGRVGGGGADGGHHNRNSGKPIIHLNLTSNQDVNEADIASRPNVLVKGDGISNPDFKAHEKDEIIQCLRVILNKRSPKKFETLVEEIIKLKIDTQERVEAVVSLVFEKAIDEPNFLVSYASICHRLINEVKAHDKRMESGTKSNLGQFRNALLDKTEREFTQNVTKSSAKEKKLQPMRENISMCKDVNERIELEALLEKEERKIQLRSDSTVRFIGELFNNSILTGKIIRTCIQTLLKDPNNEDMLECLCKLLTTVGQKFEQTPIPRSDKALFSLDSVIQRMQTIASKSENTKISSRVRFMLQEVIDLRKKKWKSTRIDIASRPNVLVKGDGISNPDFKAHEKDEIIQCLRVILNKRSPKKFETLVEEIIKLKIDTQERVEAVVSLVFEKAIDEPNFLVSYASICHRLINEVKAHDKRMESGTKSNLGQFRNALLDKTEREFTQNVTKSSAKEKKLQPMRENISMCKDVNERIELEALLEKEERKIQLRSDSTVRFIGELFNNSILTGKIIRTCIQTLLKDPNNEDMLECLCKLLTTVGQKFEQTPIPRSDKALFSLDSVIQRMQTIASKSENTKISSRVRFMLQEVIDLRKKKWKSTRNEAP